jgi:hypothetical protein
MRSTALRNSPSAYQLMSLDAAAAYAIAAWLRALDPAPWCERGFDVVTLGASNSPQPLLEPERA